jgi:tRNA pseudouridine32 synthase/23S rRNA pseudouridine746 synthase
VNVFDPQPASLPDRVPSPFAPPRDPLALRAIEELRRSLPAVDLASPGNGKMFGVLVVARPDGQVGYLRAFSGMLGGTWFVDGYAPPVFDHARREAFWPAGEAEMAAFDRALATLDLAPVRRELAALDAAHRDALAAIDELHAAHKQARHLARATADAELLKLLARESQIDGAERKRLLAAQRAEREPVVERQRVLEAERRELEARKAARSRELLGAIHDTYQLVNARGETRSLRELFAPAEPPGGAGDCAAPKLLAQAYREGLTPLAFAEVWCGAPPPTGDRHDGTLYPACRGKCGPILSYALGGLPTEPLPIFGVASSREPLRLVFEDAWLVVVDKPVGLLSVPGRGEQLRDCVQSRLRERHPELLLAHRLDLDTSGLLIGAKDLATYGALQRQFEERRIDKRYIAWVSGEVVGDEGTIELALRVDVDDRPRQIVDPVHGKPAITAWRVLERIGTRTRVAFFPHTGRTHQLRVHASHPAGLDAPIVGDRLYARVADDEPRMLLHAEAVAFTHPHTNQRISLESKAPF